MAIKNLLYKSEVKINDDIKVMIPTVGEVLEHEEEYYNLVYMLTASPADMMVQLDDMGIDFTTIDEYQLFLSTFIAMKDADTSLIFGDLDISKFQLSINPVNNMVVLRDNKNQIMIDRGIQVLIADAIRSIHHLKRNTRKPANAAARKYMIQRAREKLRRRKGQSEDSQLEELIVALVNTEQFPYTFETVKELTIYQFNECVQQVVKKIDFDNRMRGIYAGTVSAKDMSQSDLNWLTHK